MTGILLIAAGHKYYGRLALNLILSIRYLSTINITVLAWGDALNELKLYSKHDFNIIELNNDDILQDNNMCISRLKTKLIHFTPYDNTLFLDVDSLIFKNIDSLINELSTIEFTCQNAAIKTKIYGERSIMHWATESDVHTALNITTPIQFQVHSFFIWFKKTNICYNFFNTANDIYEKLYNGDIVIPNKNWNGTIADELCFTISGMLCGILPHILIWGPIAVPDFKYTTEDEIYDNHYGMTIPTNFWEPDNIFYKYYHYLITGYYKHFSIKEYFLFREKPYFSINFTKLPINLLLQYHYDEDRDGEYMFCIKNNLNNPNIDRMYIFTQNDLNIQDEKLTIIPIYNRLTYEDFFNYSNTHLNNSICIIANTDIFFDHSLELIHDIKHINKFFICLSKWNIQLEGEPVLSKDAFNSQDAWIYMTPIQKFNSNFELGQPGCDNKIAYEAEFNNLITTNPSGIIKAYHFHLTKKRNWHFYRDMLHGNHLLLAPVNSINQISFKQIRKI